MTKVLVTGGSGFIGTSLCIRLSRAGYEVVNIDVERPQVVDSATWVCCDILDQDALDVAFEAVKPDVVVHLAARTDTLSTLLAEYDVNVLGTENVCTAAIRAGVDQFLHVSSQYVHILSADPSSDLSFSPFTAYGESKVESEKIVRKHLTGELSWSILRPTNIWGPRHPRYPFEFWSVLQRGLYFHPKLRRPAIRAYGYVENVTWQVHQLMEQPRGARDERVFYVGDRPIDLDLWVDGFSLQLTGRRARRLPVSVLWLAARLGDLLKLLGVEAPLTSSRFRNMIESSGAPMAPVHALLGEPPYSLAVAIDETCEWLRSVELAGAR